jgi:type III secretory pathway lipoprotein EscJ
MSLGFLHSQVHIELEKKDSNASVTIQSHVEVYIKSAIALTYEKT